jgi:hypothetical protein
MLAALTLLLSSGAANACLQTSSRSDLTCVSVTDELLVSLEGATKVQVIETLGANGRLVDHDKTLHFASTAVNGGWLNFRFENDRVVIIFALMVADDGTHGDFIWNQANHFACSDLPDSYYKRCNE